MFRIGDGPIESAASACAWAAVVAAAHGHQHVEFHLGQVVERLGAMPAQIVADFAHELAGPMSGAFMMYLSPLLDKVVKPAKPVANFAVDHQGTTVMFHNRSAGGSEGWWDFGDGSPLEPVLAGQEAVSHTYANPGAYIAK